MYTLLIIHNQLLLDADANGQEFGIKCVAGLAVDETTTNLIVPAATGNLIGAWAAVLKQHSVNWSHSTGSER